MSSEEARQTLKTLEQLIAVAVWMGVRKPDQRAALYALKRRRTVLKKMLAARRALAPQAVVPLAKWRGSDAPLTAAGSRGHVRRDARPNLAAL